MASDQLEWNFGRCQNQLRYRTNLLTDARDGSFSTGTSRTGGPAMSASPPKRK